MECKFSSDKGRDGRCDKDEIVSLLSLISFRLICVNDGSLSSCDSVIEGECHGNATRGETGRDSDEELFTLIGGWVRFA